jgi:hypothetical protein
MTTETQLLRRIADIAHAGGLQGLSVESAQNEIRRLTTPYWQAALSAPAQPASGEAVCYISKASLAYLKSRPVDDSDATVRYANGFPNWLPAREREQYIALTYVTPPASQEQGGSVVLVGERVRAMHRECATMDLHERCHECQAYASQEQAQPSTCAAVQHSDQMVCDRCKAAWDVNDPAPPECLPASADAETRHE